MSRCAAELGLDRPLFSLLEGGGLAPLLLDRQYRMHPAIAAFPSARFYGGRLVDGVEPSARPPVAGLPWPSPVCPVLLLPVAGVEVRARHSGNGGGGGGGGAATEGEGASYHNRPEAEAAVAAAVAALRDPSVECCALLTPYAGQARLLTRLAHAALEAEAQRRSAAQQGEAAGGDGAGAAQQEGLQQRRALDVLEARLVVSTVDGFQGREADCVIFSAVRRCCSAGLWLLPRCARISDRASLTTPRCPRRPSPPAAIRSAAWASSLTRGGSMWPLHGRGEGWWWPATQTLWLRTPIGARGWSGCGSRAETLSGQNLI